MASSTKPTKTPRASTIVEPAAHSPEPLADVAPLAGLSDKPEKLGAPAFDPACDSSTSWPRFVHWYASGADGGRRSFLATARHFGVDESTVRAQARAGRWHERCAQHSRVQLARELDAGLAVQRRAVVAQLALAERLTAVIERAVARLEEEDSDELEPTPALAMIEPALEAAKALSKVQLMGRVALGLPTSGTRIDVRVEHANAAPDMSEFDGMSPEEIMLLDALERAKLKRLGNG